MKKYVSILLAVVMLVLFAVPQFASAADEPLAFEVTVDKTEAKPGDTITVAVKLTKNPGLNTIIITPVVGEGLTLVKDSRGRVAYDKTGTILDGVTSQANFVMDFGDEDDSDATGHLLTFQATVGEDAALGVKTIGVAFREAYDIDLTKPYKGDGFAAVTNATVTVVNPATGIAVAADATTIETAEGKNTTNVTATLTPANSNSTVTWASSNPEIATVTKEGVTATVTGLKPGTVTITATVEGTITATVDITVDCSHVGGTHTERAKAPTCSVEGYTGDEVCDVCGDIVTMGETIEMTPHDFKPVGAHEPTCTAPAYTGDQICTVCGWFGERGEEYGEPLGHKPCDEVQYTWYFWGDEVACEAYIQCEVCGKWLEYEVAEATAELVKEATDTEPGEYKLTATFENEAFETQTTTQFFYKVAEQKYVYKSGSDFSFTVPGAKAGLSYVYISIGEGKNERWFGVWEDEGEIEMKDGVITISKTFFDRISEYKDDDDKVIFGLGKCTVHVYLEDGSFAEFTMEVVDRPLGDSVLSLVLWSSVALISLAGATVAGIKIKKATER